MRDRSYFSVASLQRYVFVYEIDTILRFHFRLIHCCSAKQSSVLTLLVFDSWSDLRWFSDQYLGLYAEVKHSDGTSFKCTSLTSAWTRSMTRRLSRRRRHLHPNHSNCQNLKSSFPVSTEVKLSQIQGLCLWCKAVPIKNFLPYNRGALIFNHSDLLFKCSTKQSA